MPAGFSHLRSDVGQALKDARKQQRRKQETVAEDAGIAHASLSRIESGKVVPKLETVQALLDVLRLPWDVVAVRDISGSGEALPRSAREERMFEEGQNILEGRRAMGKTLRELSRECGISAGQLSRIERGISGGASIFRPNPAYLGLPAEERPLIIVNPVLARVAYGEHQK